MTTIILSSKDIGLLTYLLQESINNGMFCDDEETKARQKHLLNYLEEKE